MLSSSLQARRLLDEIIIISCTNLDIFLESCWTSWIFLSSIISPGLLRLQVWNPGDCCRVSSQSLRESLSSAADSCGNHTRYLNESRSSTLSCLINSETKDLISLWLVDWSDSTSSVQLCDMFVSLLPLPLLSFLQLPSYGDGVQLFVGFWWVTSAPSSFFSIDFILRPRVEGLREKERNSWKPVLVRKKEIRK